MRTVTIVVAALALAMGCSSPDSTPEKSPEPRDTMPKSPSTGPTSPGGTPTTPASSPARKGVPEPVVAGTIAERLTTPWGVVFLPDGGALVSERNTARIKRIDKSGRVSTVGTIRGVASPSGFGEGGLLGIELKGTTLYAYYTADSDNRIAKMSYDGKRLGRPQVILTGIPQAPNHNGGRLLFGPDGFLYVATGDGANPPNGQDKGSLGGKILRITTNGDPAPGNPFGTPVWTYGHRNIEGLAFDEQGRLWASEFGQDAWDELNLIQRGKNYGWPDAEGRDPENRFTQPVHVWKPGDASPAGLVYADGALWMAALRGERLWRIPVEGGKATGKPKAYFTEKYGRLRTVVRAPDDSLWLTTSDTDGRTPESEIPGNADSILRLTLR